MTELDFDELDKAVNSIMAGVDTSKRNTALDDPEDKVVSIDASQAEASPVATTPEPVVVAPSVEAKPAQDVQPAVSPAPATPLAVKRRGQFMDVIHPSSDMKTASAAPKREGVSIQPVEPFTVPEPKPVDNEPMNLEPTTPPVVDVVTTEATVTVEPASPTESEAESTQTQAWPDPIDAAVQVEEKEATAADESPVESLPDDVVNEVSSTEAEQPLSSPFLPDAKVEKRPLGTAASFPESVATPDIATPAPTPLPDELKDDVMSLESSSTEASPAEPSTQEDSSHSVKASAASTATTPALPGSIPQQYSEQPSTGEQSNSSIYDTSTHHQPLDTGAKKASPVKWVILAVVLLIVGALAGAAYFYFTTQ
jgi:hypothetical protein